MFFISVLSLFAISRAFELCKDGEMLCFCGANNVTICRPHVSSEPDPCEKFRHCESCSDDLHHCLTCPPGKTGAYCTVDSDHMIEDGARNASFSRRKRSTRCSDVPAPKLGSIRCITSRYEKECIGTCLPGHFFSDVESEEITLRCQNGRWYPVNSFPPCTSAGFCELAMTGAGSYNCTTGSQGTRCDVRCTGRPYVNSRYFCYPGEGWQPPLPHCIAPKENASPGVNCNCQNGGTCDRRSGTCRCPPNYTGANCEIASYPVRPTCRDPGGINNGDRIDDEAIRNQLHEEGSVVAYVCGNGFTLRGSSRLTCLQQGTWSSSVPTCQRVRTTPAATTARPEIRTSTCRDPGFVSNGERWYVDSTSANSRMQSFPEGTSLVFSCRENFALHGQSLITCQASGQWSRSLPQCRRINAPPISSTSTTTESFESIAYCADPGTDPNGSRTESMWLDARKQSSGDEEEFPQGMQLEYSCRDGYTLQGDSIITCLYTGYWSNARPVCRNTRNTEQELAYCDDPGLIDNGKRTFGYSISERSGTNLVDDGDVSVPEGTVVEYKCDDGFTLSGKDTLTCLPSGRWSDRLPECRQACGKASISVTRRIIRGNKTSSGEWPWQVAIAVAKRRGRPEIICGGVVINSRTVMTAAHCVDGVKIHRTSLYFGKYHLDMEKDDDKVEIRQPTTFVVHPRYNRESYDSDIAIIRFNPEVKMSTRIRPICLPTAESTRNNLVNGKLGYVIGWGLTEQNVHPDALLVAKVPFVAKAKCERAYKDQQMEFPITENMYCAGFDEGKVDSCTGDSGGPMTFEDPVTKSFVLEGLVSYGVWGGCGLPRRYTIYTKVGNLMTWVRANLQ